MAVILAPTTGRPESTPATAVTTAPAHVGTRVRVRAFLAEILPLFDESAADSDSLRDLGLDSLATAELITFLRDEVGLRLGDDALSNRNLGSVERLVVFIESRKAG